MKLWTPHTVPQPVRVVINASPDWAQWAETWQKGSAWGLPVRNCTDPNCSCVTGWAE